MPIVLSRGMKNKLEQVLLENAQGGPSRSIERLQLLKMEVVDEVTFHNCEQMEMEDIIKNQKLELDYYQKLMETPYQIKSLLLHCNQRLLRNL